MKLNQQLVIVCLTAKDISVAPVDSLHKVVQENDVREAQTDELEFGWESTKICEVMELRCLRKVQIQVAQVGTFLGQVLEDLEREEEKMDIQWSDTVSTQVTCGVISSVVISKYLSSLNFEGISLSRTSGLSTCNPEISGRRDTAIQRRGS